MLISTWRSAVLSALFVTTVSCARRSSSSQCVMDVDMPKPFASRGGCVALDDAIDGIFRRPELGCNILPQEGAREMI